MLICRPQPERDDKRGVIVERRDFLKFGAGAALPFFVSNASALDYPARAAQVIVGQAAASSSDITARLVSQYLSQHLGQQFVVEVRPGRRLHAAIGQFAKHDQRCAFSQTAIRFRARHRADCRSLQCPADHGSAAGLSCQDRAGLHCLRQSQSGQDQHGIRRRWRAATCRGRTVQVHGGRRSRARSVSWLYSSSHRPPGRPSTGDVRRHAHGAAASQVRAAPRARGDTPQRLDILPDVPAMAEFLPGYEAFGWIGFGAPRDTPAAIIDTLNKTMNEAVADPAIKARLRDLGGLAELARRIRQIHCYRY